MIEKKEDHLKDSEMSEQPETDRRSIKPGPYWPPPGQKTRKVSIEFNDLQGARVDINVHISELEPVPYYPPVTIDKDAVKEAPERREDSELDRKMMDIAEGK
jgi:hypothetical protein